MYRGVLDIIGCFWISPGAHYFCQLQIASHHDLMLLRYKCCSTAQKGILFFYKMSKSAAWTEFQKLVVIKSKTNGNKNNNLHLFNMIILKDNTSFLFFEGILKVIPTGCSDSEMVKSVHSGLRTEFIPSSTTSFRCYCNPSEPRFPHL